MRLQIRLKIFNARFWYLTVFNTLCNRGILVCTKNAFRLDIQPCKTLIASLCVCSCYSGRNWYEGLKSCPNNCILFFSHLSRRQLRSSSVRKLSIWYPTRGRLDMCSASGRTLLSRARTSAQVHLTLDQTSTGLAAVGTTSKASHRAKQTQ